MLDVFVVLLFFPFSEIQVAGGMVRSRFSPVSFRINFVVSFFFSCPFLPRRSCAVVRGSMLLVYVIFDACLVCC